MTRQEFGDIDAAMAALPVAVERRATVRQIVLDVPKARVWIPSSRLYVAIAPPTGAVSAYINRGFVDVRSASGNFDRYWLPGAARQHGGSTSLTVDRPVEGLSGCDEPGAATVTGWASNKATQPWRQVGDAESRRESALAVAALATSEGLHPEVQRRLLKEVLWFMTEWGGKYATRYRSTATLQLQAAVPTVVWRKRVAHEHVVTRKQLSRELLEAPDDDDARWAVLSRAVACIVTKEEHALLTTFDNARAGWERYVAAGVSVVDMATGEVLTPADIAATLVTAACEA